MGNFDISDKAMKTLIKSQFHSYPNYEMSCMYSLDYNLIYTTAYNFISLICGKYNEKVYDTCKMILFQFIENDKFLNYSPFLTAVAIFKLSKQICGIRKFNYYEKFFKNKRVIEIENILKANYSDVKRYINSNFEENYSPIKVKLSNYHINNNLIKNNNNNMKIKINNNLNNHNNNVSPTPNNLKKLLYRKIPYSYQKKFPLNNNHPNPSPTFRSSNNNSKLNYSSSKKIFYRYNINKNYTNLNNSGSNTSRNDSYGAGSINNLGSSKENSYVREGNYRIIRDNSYGYDNNNSYGNNNNSSSSNNYNQINSSSSSNNFNQINNSSDFVYSKNLKKMNNNNINNNNHNNMYFRRENFLRETSNNRRELLNISSNSTGISNNIPLIKKKKNIINSNIIRKTASRGNNLISNRINYNEINNRIGIDLGQVSKLSFERLAKLSIRYLKKEKCN
jgi:hypothetical protein